MWITMDYTLWASITINGMLLMKFQQKLFYAFFIRCFQSYFFIARKHVGCIFQGYKIQGLCWILYELDSFEAHFTNVNWNFIENETLA